MLPFLLLMGRVAAFISVAPIFGWRSLPTISRAGIALLLTVFFAMISPPGPDLSHVGLLMGGILLAHEILTGLALGLAIDLVYSAAKQAGALISVQMGLSEADIYDPISGEGAEAMSLLFDMSFALLFLAGGGHHLLLRSVMHSYDVFPMAQGPSLAVMADAMVGAGSTMLLFALKLAAPVVAAFVVLSTVLAILARVLPEMNILFTSLPLRVGMGLLLAAAILPTLDEFAVDLADWISRGLLA